MIGKAFAPARSFAALMLAFWLALLPTALSAQTATADWGTAGASSLNAMPNPTNITASDGTSVDMAYSSVTNGGTFVPVYGGSFVSYFAGTLGGTSSILLLNFDNSNFDTADRVTTDITLGRNVTNLAFSITDIDSGGFTDAFEVYYDNGSGTFQNAATNTAFWTGNSTVLRTNNATMNGWRGNGGSATTETLGDLSFNFGTTTVKRIRIVYFSYTGTGDPSAQIAGVSGLSFTQNPLYADLSLTKARIGANPASGGDVTWRLTLSSATASTQTAANVTVQDTLPTGFTYVSHSASSGTFNPSTGLWSLTNVAAGNTRTLDITGIANVSSGTTITNIAEIASSSSSDIDSLPGNGAAGEDDYATATFTTTGGRTAGVVPALSCPAGTILFDWDTRAWTEGSTNNTYALGGIGDLNFNLVNPGTWLGGTTFGGQSPNRQTIMNGGNIGQNSIVQFVNQASRTAEVTTTITLPAVMSGAQFELFDVDFGANQFADRVTVTGRLGATTVVPVLTNGIANYVSGNSAFGDGVSDSDSPNGTVTATFSSNIDTIVITYGNHSAAPSNPGQQAMALHDITFCRPTTTIAAAKTSTIISDPVNGTSDPKAIPGALIRYCITLTNTGAAAASNLMAADMFPPEFAYTAASIRSGTTCTAAATVEDDDNTGADESDPVGASVAGGTLTITAATLAASEVIAVTFDGTIN